MKKRILITGVTDGIGLETARILAEQGHELLLHGRSENKLYKVSEELSKVTKVESHIADLSDLDEVVKLANSIEGDIDVLINNAGVLKASNTQTKHGIDIRFVVNTIAPYLLTKKLLKQVKERVVNLSSAAQAPVLIEGLKGEYNNFDDMSAYAQSKLAITQWSFALAKEYESPLFIAVNPGSLLASKMVKEGFGVEGSSLSIGADILVRAALSDEFENASGKYFDNDSNRFASPQPDALNDIKNQKIIETLNELIKDYI